MREKNLGRNKRRERRWSENTEEERVMKGRRERREEKEGAMRFQKVLKKG